MLSLDVIHIQRDQIDQYCAKEEKNCMTVTRLMTAPLDNIEDL